MSQNRIKYTLENLKNIISDGNEQLIQFENKVFTLKDFHIKPKNKLHMDQNGELYTLDNNKRVYQLSKEKYGLMPNFCPQCGRIMGKKQYDSFFWNIHKRCFDCSMKLQNQMRQNGTWEAYVWNFMRDNLVNTCNLAIEFYEGAMLEGNKEVLINAQGQTEQWNVEDVQKFNNMLEKTINQIKQYRDKAIQYFQEKLSNVEKQKTLQGEAEPVENLEE